MTLLFTLIVYILVFALVWWVIGLVPMPPTLRTITLVVFALIVLLVLFDLLTGHPLGLPAVR